MLCTNVNRVQLCKAMLEAISLSLSPLNNTKLAIGIVSALFFHIKIHPQRGQIVMSMSVKLINGYQQQYQQRVQSEQTANDISHRQEFAATAQSTVKPATRPPAQQIDKDSANQDTFLTSLMDQMLANRLGLDRQKYNEILLQIEKAMAEKDSLTQLPPSSERDNKITALDAKIDQFGEALQGLIEAANGNRERQEQEKQGKFAVQQYQITMHPTKINTLSLRN